MCPEPSQIPQKRLRQKRSVSFANLEIREYSQVLGDHPYCRSGPPISLGWDFEPAFLVEVEEYESTREPRRTRRQMRMGSERRREILMETDGVTNEEGCGYTNGDLRRAERRRWRDNQSVATRLQGFFVSTI